LLQAEQQRQTQQRADARKGQIGTGDRSEKVRTYNFPQSRVTDHRIGFTSHALADILEGQLDELVAALRQAERELRVEGLQDGDQGRDDRNSRDGRASRDGRVS